MKEFNLAEKGLTTQAPKAYSKGGDKNMAENGEGENPRPMTPEDTLAHEARIAKEAQQNKTNPEARETAKGGAGRGGNGGEKPPVPPYATPPEDQNESGNSEKGPPLTDTTLIRLVGEIGRMDPQNPIYSEFLRNQIRRIQELQGVNKVNPEEAWRLQESLYLKLGNMMQAQAREDPAQQKALRDIGRINSGGGEAKERGKEVINVLRDISTSEGLSSELINSIMEYDNALEYLVNRIISEPLDAETSGYQLSFYGGINFALIRDRMRVWSERERTAAFGKEKGDKGAENSIAKAENKEGLSLKFEYMKSGAELFHNMNWKIVTGDIEQFVGVARGITVEHLQVLQRVKLTATVMRLYDQELQNVISKDGKITPENYADVTGTILDDKGSPTGKKLGRVEKLLSLYNNSLPLAERLESWQLKWAFYTGRNMMNITLRPAELIAQSKEIGYRSYVQESASRIIDPINLTGERFGIAEPRGGVHFLHMIKENFDKDKERFGWGKNGIKTMMGGDRIEFESRGIFNISGIWSGWRENNIVQLWETDPGPNPGKVDMRWEKDGVLKNPDGTPKMRRKTISIETLMHRKDTGGKEKGEVDALKDKFLTDGKLKNEFQHSLGIMLKIGDLLPHEKRPNEEKYQELLEAKREIRTEIWKRTAMENPLAMINFLRGMRFEKEPEGHEGINERLIALDKAMFTSETGFEGSNRWAGNEHDKKDVLKGAYEEKEEWTVFREKLLVAHERRMKQLSEEQESVNLEDIKGHKIPNLDDVIKEMGFDKDEYFMKNLAELRKLGEIIAPNLAEVRFPSNPFMNDVLLEDAKYTQAGSEFFRRRLGGDIPSFHHAGGNIPKLMDNPGGIPHEEALKVIAEMERALESPNGTESGQNDVAPVFEAYLEFTEAGGNAEDVPGFVKFLNQESAIGIQVRKMMRKPNSWAQMYAGPGALAEDLFQTSKTLDEALKMGIVRRATGKAGETWTDLYDKFRKKHKAKPLWFILRYLFDALPIFVFGSVVDVTQKSAKSDKG